MVPHLLRDVDRIEADLVVLLAQGALHEEEAEAADLQPRPLDQRRLADPLAVDVDAVGAVQVGDRVLRAVPAHLRVAAGDLRVVQHEVVVAGAADTRLLAAEQGQRGGDSPLVLGGTRAAALGDPAPGLSRAALARPLDARFASQAGRLRLAVGIDGEDQQVIAELDQVARLERHILPWPAVDDQPVGAAEVARVIQPVGTECDLQMLPADPVILDNDLVAIGAPDRDRLRAKRDDLLLAVRASHRDQRDVRRRNPRR